MSDAQSQLAEIEALIAASPDDPSLLALKDDLLKLIALEAQAGEPSQQSAGTSESASTADDETNEEYEAKGAFTQNAAIQSSIAEAPDISEFQPVSKAAAAKTGRSAEAEGNQQQRAAPTEATESKKKKKKKSSSSTEEDKFELPSHLIPLESDTPAQKLKKSRTAKALKSKFREKQKEAAAEKKKSDWKSFARKKGVAGGSMFSTEEGIDARVGVVSGGGRRGMTESERGNKRHKFA